MALNGVFMRVHVNINFFENYVCTMLFFSKPRGVNICFSKYPAMYKRGLSVQAPDDIPRRGPPWKKICQIPVYSGLCVCQVS